MSGPGSGEPPDDQERDDDSRADHRIGDDSRSDESADRSPPESDGRDDPVGRDGPNQESNRHDGGTRDAGGNPRGTDTDASPTAVSGTADGPSADGGDPDYRAGQSGADSPAGESDDVRIADDGIVRWFLGTDNGTVVVVRDVASSVAVVVLIGLLLFAVSGIWPPMVAVESGSMEPNMQKGDLVFVVEADRFVGDGAVDGTGIVTREDADDHEKFGQGGDVIVFRPGGSDYRTPVIHRAHFWVEEGENWVATKANDDFLNGETCAQLQTCPAPRDGFVTKGDANSGYDQAHGGARTTVVSPDWVTGKAMFRIPLLGHVRLTFDAILSASTVGPTPELLYDLDRSPGLSATTGASPAVAVAGAAGSAAVLGRRRFGS